MADALTKEEVVAEIAEVQIFQPHIKKMFVAVILAKNGEVFVGHALPEDPEVFDQPTVRDAAIGDAMVQLAQAIFKGRMA